MFGGQGYGFSSCERIIMENNVITGCDFMATGNGMTSVSLSAPLKAMERVYYSNNKHLHYYGNNREMMTLDGAGGAYYGGVSGVKGTVVSLSGEPKPLPPAYKNEIKRNWAGALVRIVVFGDVLAYSLTLDGRHVGCGSRSAAPHCRKRRPLMDRTQYFFVFLVILHTFHVSDAPFSVFFRPFTHRLTLRLP